MYPLYLATTYLKVCCNREHSALEFVTGRKVVVGCLVCSTEAACSLNISFYYFAGSKMQHCSIIVMFKQILSHGGLLVEVFRFTTYSFP